MKKEFLEKLGLEAEVIREIMTEAGKDEREIVRLQRELEKANGAAKSKDKEIEALKENAKAAETRHAEEMTGLRIDTALEKGMLSYRAKTPKAVRALIDMEKVKLEKDGTVSGIEEQLKSLSEGEETKYLFNSGVSKLKGTQPGYGADDEDDGGVDLNNMTYSQTLAYMKKNPDVKIFK